MDGAPRNSVGGTVSGARNIISGNRSAGIYIIGASATGNRLLGNYIGTDATGTDAVGNSRGGVWLDNARSNTVGGVSAEARNVISGNHQSGVYIWNDATGSVVQGNYIGITADGSAALGNRGDGVDIDGPSNVTIGGAGVGSRNIISGNERAGIFISYLRGATSGTRVQGNFIGTDVTGKAALGNGSQGLHVRAASTVVGGTAERTGNVVSGNRGVGVHILGGSGSVVQGNSIGTDADSAAALGNASHGVEIQYAPNTMVGGTTTEARNVIANNGGSGVSIYHSEAVSNAIQQNSIFSNRGLGIDLDAVEGDWDGVTGNDVGDGDRGANERQNFPILTSITTRGSSASVVGTLNSKANSAYKIEFFSNPQCDAPGHGEGRTFLGPTSVTTDGSGNASFTATLPSVPVGAAITATVTDSQNNTSEFSACRAVAEGPPTAATLVSPSGSSADTTPTYTWNAVSGSTWYMLWVNGPSGNVIQQWYTAEQAGCAAGTGTCAITPTTALVGGAHTWWIRTWSPAGAGPWSAGSAFTVNTTPPPSATLVSPSGATTDSTPTYTWNAVDSSTWYMLWVNGPSGNVLQQWYTAEQAGCAAGTGACSVTPTAALAGGGHTWWVRTWNTGGAGPWSSEMTFTVTASNASEAPSERPAPRPSPSSSATPARR